MSDGSHSQRNYVCIDRYGYTIAGAESLGVKCLSKLCVLALLGQQVPERFWVNRVYLKEQSGQVHRCCYLKSTREQMYELDGATGVSTKVDFTTAQLHDSGYSEYRKKTRADEFA
ncbi:hypothetical protein MKEN_00354000 [Mycena kentingensis (nom. inval.)]|nr:hypothetical protein MKEN_00354000 [Mycena kentingensis (nom. inval.)]